MEGDLQRIRRHEHNKEENDGKYERRDRIRSLILWCCNISFKLTTLDYSVHV